MTIMDRSRLDSPDDVNQSSVSLPDSVVERIDHRLEHSPFESVDSYVTYVLEEVLARIESGGKSEGNETIDEKEIERRLRSLGYLE
ncbi:MAG: hypothetical protein U5K37_01165 [Natrialbaceae archaeon]|nr:hypothetical protein [Natrialbaceae archaeon]